MIKNYFSPQQCTNKCCLLHSNQNIKCKYCEEGSLETHKLDGYQGQSECYESDIFCDALDLSESEKTKKGKIYQPCILYLSQCKNTVMDNILLSGQFNLGFKCCHFMHSGATVQVLILEGI